MEDEDKAASKPSDPQGTDKHTGATTFATSVERETVFPAIAFGSSSNFAYQDILEGSMSSDARITMCGSVGRYNSSTMPRVNRNLHVDTTLNLANDNPDTVRECMPSEKMTASFPDQSVESNSNASVVIEGGKLANESFHLQTGFVPHEVTSSKLKLHYEENIPAEGNKNANVVGQFELRGPDSLQNQESPAQDNEAGTTINDQLYEKAERASSKDGNVASAKTSVDDKKTSVDDTNTTNTLGTLNAEASNRSISIINFTNFANRLNERDCGALQTFGENPAQVKEVGMTGDDVSYKEVEGALGEDEYIASAKKTPAEGAGRANNLETCNVVWCNSPVSERNSLNAVNGMNEREWLENIAIERKAGRTVDDVPYKEAEKVSSEDEDFDFTDKTSVDGANLTANLGTGEASTSPKREMKNSGPVNLNENLPGTSGLIQCAETGAVSSDAGCTANGIRNGHVSSSFLVDATEVVTEKLATDVKTITKDVTLAGVGLTTEIRNAVVDQSIFEGKPNDFKSSRNGQSSAYAEHNSAFTGLIHNIIGQSSGDTTSVTNIKASDAVSIGNLACSDATPIANIAPCDANILTKMQGPLNAIPDMILVDGNTSESCRTELPSIEPGSFTAAISEGGLEFYAKQDATQTCPEYGVKEELAKEDAIQTCAQGSVGEEVAKQDTCAEQSMEEEVTKQDAMETCTEHHGEEETTKRDEEPVKQGAMQTSVECGRGEEVIGQKVKKKFGKRNYKGKVVGFDQETLWYKVTYEDGDVEDLEWEELEPILLHLKGENLEMKRRKRHSRLGVEPRSFKRVRRPNEPMASKARGRGRPAAEKGKSVEIDDGKEDEKSGLDNEDFSIVDSADMPSSATKTSKRRHSEQLDESIKKTKVEGEAGVEHDCSRNRTRLTVESKPQIHSDLTENRFSTRRNSASSASNLESVSGLNADTANSVPNFQDKAKSEIPELSDKNVLPQGGGISLIGRKTKKDFGGQCYEGEVIDYDYRAKYYKVKYEDGDEEELDWSELEPTLVLSDQKPLSFKSLLRARNMAARLKVQQQSTSSKDSASNLKETLVLDQGAGVLSEKQKPASVLEEVKESSQEKENSPGRLVTSVELTGRMPPPPRPLAAARFASAGDADVFEYYGWGEVVGYDKAKCPELGASKLLPTSSPIVHLAASQHHLAAITAAGQVWLWRNKHGNIHTRCNEWEHIASLEDKGTVLVDIAGPDLDRASGGYEADQEDQVPDPFYLVAVCADGQDFILQGSQPQETVRTYQLNDEPQHPSLKAALLQQGHSALETVGRIVQVSVGTVEAPDESPLVGYIADNDHVYIRSATRDYMEEVNLVSGFTGKPIKIQCGRVYHAIIMTDDGRAWTWGCGYYPGLNTLGSSGFSAATCQPAVGTLVGRKVIDVGCYGEDFIALTSDGDVHQWTHAVPNPAAGVYNVPATPLYGHGPCIPHGDKLKQVSIGAGMCAGVTESGRVHTWRTAMKGGLIGILVSEKEALTPLGHEENHKDTAIVSLGNRIATKVICIAGSLIVVVKKKARGRIGPRRKRQKNNSESVIGEQS